MLALPMTSLRSKPSAPSHRPLGKDHDAVGLSGEEAFAARYGYSVDYEYAQRGDGGADFRTRIGTVDVKTYRKPNHLLVEAGKVRADAYVLARHVDVGGEGTAVSASLIGWATRAEALAAAVTDVGGFGVQSHALRVAEIRGISSLDALLGGWCVGCGATVLYPGATFRLPAGPRDFAAVCPACYVAGWALVVPAAARR